MRLTPDEMYVLAQNAVHTPAPSESFSYEEVVRLATARIYEKLGLPPFRTWVVAYEEDPARFEEEMLGLWRTEPGPNRSSDPAPDVGA